MGASLALSGTGACSRAPLETIVPYREGPAQDSYGTPIFYATAISRDGYGCGVLVETNMGRPTKLEGNPMHPASLGATDAITQGEVLELWDPDRSQSCRREHAAATWEQFLYELQGRLAASHDGSGIHLLTETVTSPSLDAQRTALLAKYPRARWHQYQPLNRDNVYDGSRIAFGEALEPHYKFAGARIIVALDADVVGSLPGSVRYARDIARMRNWTDVERMARVYVAEGTPSLTGAMADHRRVTRTGDIGALTRMLAVRLGIARAGADSRHVRGDAWLDAVVADLEQNGGACVIVAGDRQPPYVHALVHAMNDMLGNINRTIVLGEPIAFDASSSLASIRALSSSMVAGDVDSLLILGGNPVYHAPADLDFLGALARVPWSAHLGLYHDETAANCTWHIPAAHVLETWGDIRAFDGTTSIQQPCIAPLFNGRSSLEVVSAIVAGHPLSPYDIVRGYWRHQAAGAFEGFWRDALFAGVLPATANAAAPLLKGEAIASRANANSDRSDGSSIELVFAPDPTLGDGRHANNGWLQELPKPLTTLTWDNALLVSPALAERFSIVNEEVVEVSAGGRNLRAPIWIVPGHADRSMTLYLGNGRSRAGTVGTAVGVDAFALRTSEAPWVVADATLAKTGKRYPLAAAQSHNRMQGRDIVRTVTRDDALFCQRAACEQAQDRVPLPSLYPEFAYDGYKWAMSIDLSSCIGCAACTIACQAENNIPVVGREEVRNGREMHWIRIDRYYSGSRDAPQTAFQPIPCMQCEHAPCEEVCPVEASVHDAEGLNVQVYNRCVGTRFCSNNCPYKVRRFNFFDYTRNARSLAAQRNPEVTVRMRGVMEKCTYCVQRIANARSNADRENRRIGDGEVVTACQAVCPTQAIVFGDLNDPSSAVNKRKASQFDYALLAELNTRPRTTYLPKLSNAVAGIDPP